MENPPPVPFLGGWVKNLQEPIYCIDVVRDKRGLWRGKNPIDDAFTVFISQFVIITAAYVMFRFLLKPLRQPKFVCSVLAGIVASPQVMELTKLFPEKSFPHEEILLVRTVGALGATYILFLTAVKTDVTVVERLLKKALFIGFASVNMSTAIIFLLVRKMNLPGVHKGFFVFLFAGGISLVRFPNVVYAFDELNISTSDLGQLAMSTSMLCEVYVLARMMMDVYFKSDSITFWAVSSALALLLIIFGVVGRLIRLIIRKTPEGQPLHDLCILSISIGALLIAFLADMIGTLPFGVIIFGLVIPHGPPLGSALTEKVELVAMEIFMPMFYVGVGYSVDLASINMTNSRKIILAMIAGALAKLVGATLAALCCKIRLRHSVLLGLLLNIRGPFDLFLFLRWTAEKAIDSETFTMVVLSEVAISAVVTPLIDIFYNPHSRLSASSRKCTRSIQKIPRNVEVRILCCIHNQEDVPGTISLLEASNSTVASPTFAYVVHLKELVGRATPVIAPYKRHMKRVTSGGTYHIMRAFENYSNNSNHLAGVEPYTVNAAYKGMHEYVCRFAQEKFIPLIIIPFQGSHEMANALEAIALRNLRENIRDYAPCTVGTFIDKGMHRCMGKGLAFSCKIGVVFIAGPHDREALALAIRMVGRPDVTITVHRIIFHEVDMDIQEVMDKEIDDALINEFRAKKVDIDEGNIYREVEVRDSEQVISQIGNLKDKFDLIMVGQKRRVRGLFSEETMLGWTENPELGVIGDLVASSEFCGQMTSVLVMKHPGDTNSSYHGSISRKPEGEQCLLERTNC
ncbi:hypothetical protein EUGRSUZ_G03095 [Eucalyptus grandis]|uniref:Uncharacterized protein n=2 Tax=Eucalyptus grandis TaxID=71139 RepID=A0A059BHL3_EUCGR|nr:hypothetical protein EUGRSUZ_G03095 [Eucalyptus grandis]